MRRRLLLWTTVLLMLAGIGCAMVPFGRAWSPNAEARNNDTFIAPVGTIYAGKLTTITVNGRHLFILRPSPEQWQAIHQLDALVWDRRMPAWNKELKAFVYWGHGTRWGWDLTEAPPPHSNLTNIAESNDAPWFFSPGEKPSWLGGYWNDVDEVSYDYAGRAIKDWDHTYNGYNRDVPNLVPAHVNLIEPEKVAVYLFPDAAKTD